MALNTEHVISKLKMHFLTFSLLCYNAVQLTVFATFVIQLRATGKDVMLCIVWVPCDILGPRGSCHLDLTVEFRLYLNKDLEIISKFTIYTTFETRK